VSEATATLVSFGRALREEGLDVGTGRIAGFCRAAALLAPDDLYWAGRATLVARPQDIPAYDRTFASFFAQLGPRAPVRMEISAYVEEVDVDLAVASPVELLREKSFDACSAEELAELAVLMTQVQLSLPLRRTRRRIAAHRGAPDLRRTLRRSFRTGGEPLERAWRTRRHRPRRIVFLLDISGSMADYSRALLMFSHAMLRADRSWEAFCFGTRLTRLTQALATANLDEALRRAGEEVVDWNGGTRIGESLKRFLDEYGHPGAGRGAVVVICSDGLEVGDPELLADQMARLSRLARQVVWLNPLKGDPAYEPLVRGMRAALPYVDVFASGHNLASLEDVAATLELL
jgi:uncharacterized protein with von Willebrand factor type A (vWA) domain